MYSVQQAASRPVATSFSKDVESERLSHRQFEKHILAAAHGEDALKADTKKGAPCDHGSEVDLRPFFPPAFGRALGWYEPPQVSGPAEAGVFRLHSGRRAGCASRIHERDRHLVADRAMWPNLIVVSTPILHLFAGVRKGQEPMLVQAFRSEAAVECLDKGIVRGLART